MFDIDGTLTEPWDKTVPVELAQFLADLSLKMPLAFATGRSLEHLQSQMDQILSRSSDIEVSRKNWFVTAENGAAGYYYDPGKEDYIEFFRIEWDDNRLDRKKLDAQIHAELGDIIHSTELRRTQLLVRPKKDGLSIEERIKLTAQIAARLEPMMAQYEHGDEFEALDSTIAVHISPKNANKDQGVIRYAELLKEKGIDVGENAKNILIVGDQALPGRNDYELLNGKHGTPFTVGDVNPESEWPVPVFDGEETMHGPAGTLALIRRVF